MARYGIAIDSSRCMSCYNCFMACKDEHCGFATTVSAAQPHEGQFWMKLNEWERGDDSRKIKTASVPTPCSHCHDPACVKAARDNAVYIRPDGIVIIDPEKAKGQKEIVDACPIGAVYWNEELQLPQKCTMCAHILDDPDYYLPDPAIKMPRCVEACPNEALIFGDLDDPDSEISAKIAQETVTQLEQLGGARTNVVHLNIPRIFLAGSVYLPDDEVCAGARVTLESLHDGSALSTETNYFGDWEFDDLPKNTPYKLYIEYPGYKPVELMTSTQRDHFLGELILEKAGILRG